MNNSTQICSKAAYALFVILVLTFSSCTQSADLLATSPKDSPVYLKSGKLATAEYICNPQSASLLTKENHTIGTVDMLTTLDTRNIQVSVSVKKGWTITNIQIFVGDYSNLPVDENGTPQPEKFPLNVSFPQNQTVYSYESEPPTSEYQVVAIHSELKKLNKNGRVLQSEEAWISGTQFNNISWATYYTYRLMPCGGGVQP